MQFNPSRSWAVTYTQTWNLTMTTPLAMKGSMRQGSNFGSQNHGTGNNKSNNNSAGGSKNQNWITVGVLIKVKSVNLVNNVDLSKDAVTVMAVLTEW